MKYNKKRHELGFWQADPMPSKEELERYYGEIYYQTCSSKTYAPEYTQEEKRYFHNRALVSDYIWRRLSDKRTGSIIDIGCGEGFFVSYFAEHEWEIKACDFSSCGVERHNPQIISRFTQGDIYQILEQEFKAVSKYDFINLSNVLEHVTEPIGLLDKVKNIMHKNSLLRIYVPNDYSEFQGVVSEYGLFERRLMVWLSRPFKLLYNAFIGGIACQSWLFCFCSSC